MSTGRIFRGLIAMLVAMMLFVPGGSVLADDSSVRERHPTELTPTPAPEPNELGDGTVLPAEEPTPVETEAPPIVLINDQGRSTDVADPDRDNHVRPKPTPRSFTNPASNPTVEATKVEEPGIPRLDDTVLRWLPEIMAAAKANNVPAELIAGVMRLESDGNPNIISPDGARGLMQIMPDQLLGQGIYEDLWHDPATNIMAGGYELLERSWSYGSWEGAVGSYFGFGCDVFGTCTEVYVTIVFGWAAYYAPIIADPLAYGFGVLPSDWVAPPIVPFVEAAPVPIEEPPPPPTPTPGSGTATPTPTEMATGVPSETPTDPSGSPTVEPTDMPTDVPTAVPTDVPTEIPTEEPTDVPTEEPTEPPTEEPLPPDDPPADGESGG